MLHYYSSVLSQSGCIHTALNDMAKIQKHKAAKMINNYHQKQTKEILILTVNL